MAALSTGIPSTAVQPPSQEPEIRRVFNEREESICDQRVEQNDLNRSEYMFIPPPEDHTGPYFKKAAPLLGMNSELSLKNTKEFPNLNLEKAMKVHKAHIGRVNVDPIDNLWGIKKDEPSDLYIFAEDLDPRIMETAGLGLGILPSAFEKHLQGSEYFKQVTSRRPIARTITIPMVSTSLRWFSIAKVFPIFREGAKGLEKVPVWKHLPKCRKCTLGGVYDDTEIEILINLNRQRRQVPHDFFSPDYSSGLFPVTVAFEERTTISVRSRNTQRDVLVLLDPLSFVRIQDGDDKYVPEEASDFERTRRGNGTLQKRLATRKPVSSDVAEWMNSPEEPKHSAQSTYQDIQDWLRYQQAKGLKPCPLASIVRIVRSDTICFIDFLNLIMEQIHSAFDPTNSMAWRDYVERRHTFLLWAQNELPKMLASFRETIQYLEEMDSEFEPSYGSQHSLTEGITVILKEVIGYVEDVSIRVRATQEAINADMALVNSKKGIAEAESVKRLTELAFFFIPLTFAAAVFSIQVHELEVSPPPIWVFFLAATCLVALVYGFRLARYPDEAREWIKSIKKVYDKLYWGCYSRLRLEIFFLIPTLRLMFQRVLRAIKQKFGSVVLRRGDSATQAEPDSQGQV